MKGVPLKDMHTSSRLKTINHVIAFCALFFALLASIPLQEKLDASTISLDPDITALAYNSAGISLFFSLVHFLIVISRKGAAKKWLLLLTTLCLLISGYRMMAIAQYDDHCQHIESSTCIIEETKPLPLW